MYLHVFSLHKILTVKKVEIEKKFIVTYFRHKICYQKPFKRIQNTRTLFQVHFLCHRRHFNLEIFFFVVVFYFYFLPLFLLLLFYKGWPKALRDITATFLNGVYFFGKIYSTVQKEVAMIN